MRVLIVHNQLWAHYKAKLFSELYSAGTAQNIDFHVLQIAKTEHSRANMAANNVSVHQYHYSYDLLFDDALENVRFWPKFKALFRHFNQFKPQVLNITGYYDWAQVALLFYAKMRGVRTIISNESGQKDHQRSFFKEAIKKFILKQADGFFCFGTTSANYLLRLGAKPHQIWTTHAAVVDNELLIEKYDHAYVQRNAQKKALGLPAHNFVFVGRLISVKNLPLLLHCFQQFSAKFPNWGLMLVGEGAQKVELQQLCTQQNIENVSFVAGQAWYNVPQYLALADVLVLPSVSEPWGLVVNEAMACGMPVLVAEQCGCAPDLVQDPQNGRQFDANSGQDLSKKMEWFAGNTQNFSAMGAFSKQIISKFSPKATASEIINQLKRL